MKHSKTSLFLMELIISILFFSIASAICVQLFVKSHQISTHSVALNQSVRWCENIAELLQAYSGDTEKVCSILESESNCYVNRSDSTNSFKICFGKDWQPITAAERDSLYYMIEVTATESQFLSNSSASPQQNGMLKTFHISTTDARNIDITDASFPIIYQLDTLVYQQFILSSDGKVVQDAD